MTPAQQVVCYTGAVVAFTIAAAWGFRSATVINRLVALVALGLALVTLVSLWAVAVRV